MESELERSKGRDEDQKDEVEGDVTNTLSHASRRHLDLKRGLVVPRSMLCIQELGMVVVVRRVEGQQGRVDVEQDIGVFLALLPYLCNTTAVTCEAIYARARDEMCRAAD
jgi:hypothetical protein